MFQRSKPSHAGFSLIELLVVLCIIICLLALLSPKLWPILQKKRNMVALNDCRAVSDAMMQYTILHGGAASADNPADTAIYDMVLVTEMEDLLVSDFISRVPEFDPWGTPWEYGLFNYGGPGTFNPVGPNVYAIRSAGENGIFEGPVYDYGPFAPNLNPGDPGFVTDDIVCVDGEVVSWPGYWVDVP